MYFFALHSHSIPPYTVPGEPSGMKDIMQGVFNLRPSKTKTGLLGMWKYFLTIWKVF